MKSRGVWLRTINNAKTAGSDCLHPSCSRCAASRIFSNPVCPRHLALQSGGDFRGYYVAATLVLAHQNLQNYAETTRDVDPVSENADPNAYVLSIPVLAIVGIRLWRDQSTLLEWGLFSLLMLSLSIAVTTDLRMLTPLAGRWDWFGSTTSEERRSAQT